MNYTPTNWQTGDTITAAGLNNMESGIEAAAVVHIPVKTRNTPGYSSFYIDAADADEVYAALTKANSFVFDIYQIGFDASLIEIPCKKLVITYTAKCVYGNIPHDITMFDGSILPALKADSLYIIDNEYQSGSEWTVYNGTMFDTSPLIVTLTPTAQDFSGTLDKTVAEITAAVRAGRRIVFEMDTSESGLGMNTIRFDGNSAFEYPDGDDMWYSVEGFFVYSGMSAIVKVITPAYTAMDGYYSTEIFPLTPMS